VVAKQKQADEQTRQANFQKLMTEGKNALTAKDYPTAIDRFKGAGQLMPGNVDAVTYLSKAEQAQAASKKNADDGVVAAAKKKADFDQALKQGQNFMTAKNYDQAIIQFKTATTLFPTDATAAGLLKQAEAAHGQAAADADKLKKKTAYDQAIKQGQALLAEKKYDDAIKAFQFAGTQLPGDPTAAGLQKQAEKARTDASAATAAAVAAEYNRQMQAGATFDKQKKWDEAMKAYDAALKQVSKDARATEALTKATYNHHMTEGDKAFSARRFPDAVREYDAAVKLYPKDQDAAKALKKAKDAK
jgi:tetratricopeptide (TPR) repeat protein